MKKKTEKKNTDSRRISKIARKKNAKKQRNNGKTKNKKEI